MKLAETISRVLNEVEKVLGRVNESEIDELCREILQAHHIFVYSMGREGLVVRSFAMRLMHLGMRVAVVGDMTTPAIKDGDLLVLSCGPGSSKTLDGLTETAHHSGAQVAVITAQPDGTLSKKADHILYLAAQTMAENENANSFQPMGSVFEQAAWIFLDAVIIALQMKTGQTASELRDRHTNLE